MKKTIAFVISGLVIGAAAMALYARYEVAHRPAKDFHEHADFALFLNGERFDFVKPEFMSTKPCSLDGEADEHVNSTDPRDYVHLHDNIGSVVHVHRAGTTWNAFFDSLRMQFTDTLFVDNHGQRYEADDQNTFVFVVNGKPVDALAGREIREADRVLISYGKKNQNQQEVWAQFGQISNDACLPSGTCSHRGYAPIESCGNAAPAQSRLLKWLGIK